MKRARDVRDQLEGLMERVEIEVKSNPTDNIGIRKVKFFIYCCMPEGRGLQIPNPFQATLDPLEF